MTESSHTASTPSEPIRPIACSELHPNVTGEFRGSARGADEVSSARGPPVSLQPGSADRDGEEIQNSGRDSHGRTNVVEDADVAASEIDGSE